MKIILMLALVCLLIFPLDAFAQTRRRQGSRTRRPSATRTASESARRSAEELSAARGRIVEQIKLLTRFLYIFGRVSNNIEMSDTASAAGGQGDVQADELTTRARTSLRENLANVRAGLIELETDTRSRPALVGFYARIMGVADLAARAEQSAAANRFDEAGRTMLEVVGRLTDALREE